MIVRGTKDLCAIFGISRETLTVWQGEGLPVTERGGPGKQSVFDSVAVHTWIIDRAVRKASGETPRDRLARAQAESVELDVAHKRGLLIPAALVEPKWAAACVAAREQLLRSRRALARRLATAKDERKREAIIAEVHEQFLRTLADWRGGGQA
jgi:phage terminase Nu1 subunit (DNA packaging protein)